jgi:8-oxo-dGTP pyrophosphatase MutT (NUDIX family)
MMLATIESDAFEQRALDYLRSEPPGILDPKGNPTGDHELEMDGRPFVMASLPKPAAVLVPIVMHADEPTVLLTERASNLRDHSGQIAFPGGKIDATDASPLDTALREAEEEIGLDRGFVDPIGYLDLYATGFGFRILPTVARVKPGFRLSINRGEVDDAFEVPLSFLMNPANHQLHSKEFRGMERSYYAMPYAERYIWGATAGILRVLYERICLS